MVHTIQTRTGGTLLTWFRRPGDELHRGDALAFLETAPGGYDVIEAMEGGIFDAQLVDGSEPILQGAAVATLRVR